MMVSSRDRSAPPAVAMVTRRVHPAHGPGGLERHVYDLVVHLARQGVEIDLFAATPSRLSRRISAERAFPSGVQLHWLADRWLPLGHRRGTVVVDRITNYPLWAFHVARQILQQTLPSGRLRWPIVHAHGLAGWGLARSATRRASASALVVTTQGLEEFRSQQQLKRWAYGPFRACMRTTAAASDAVVTTDAALVPLVERHLGIAPSDQVVIPNAVDPEQCRALGSRSRGRERLASLGLLHAAPVFLSVGRLEANKGFDVLVAALVRAAPALPDSWAWVLAGDGPARGTLVRALAEAGLGGHAVLAGRVDDADLHSLYAVADWFVHPTRYEGSSIVTLEAMAHGLPVLASRAGGLPDKVEDGVTGFLVPPGDPAALGARLLDTEAVDGRAFGEAGRRLCDKRFSWDVVAPQYIALYERLSRGPHGSV